MKRLATFLFPSLIAVILYLSLDFSANSRNEPSSDETNIFDLLADDSSIEAYRQIFDGEANHGQTQAYLEETQSQLFDENGQLRYTLDTRSQARLSDTLTLLDAPQITLFDKGVEDWDISAEFGRVEHSTTSDQVAPQQQVALLGNAVLSAAATNDSSLRLRSPILIVDPEHETIASDREVEVSDEGLRQSSIGFDANLRTDTMHFHSTVKGRYEPTRPTP